MKKRKILNKYFITIITAFLFCFSAFAESENLDDFDYTVKRSTLDNGISLIIRENNEPKNRILLRLVVKAGSCMEDDDQKGVAHFVEHMCFNGTKNFEKSAIVDYFEKLGMKFGPEVNAYTNFEETVYMLELPADNPEILKTSLNVLRDWAVDVTFDSSEIEKERGVVVEEWRTRTKTLQGRMKSFEDPVYLRGSRYEQRPVLGDMDIIKTISRERIIDFYKKWYRPELMTVIAIGDFKTEEMQKSIEEIMGTIPASEEKIKLPEFTVPEQKEKSIDIMRDPEITVEEIYIVGPKKNVLSDMETYAYDFVIDIFNQRCRDITNSLDSKWINAKIGSFSKTNNLNLYFLQINPKNGKFIEAFKAFLDEYERFMNFGVTESEFSIMKQSYLQKAKQNYENRNKQQSGNFSANLVKHALTGQKYLSNEDYYKKYTESLEKMTPEIILDTAKKIFVDRGVQLLLFLPEKSEIPSNQEIMNIWTNYVSEAAKVPYENETEEIVLMDRPSKKGTIKEKKKIKELGATFYKFKNGVKVITKKTDFVKNEIQYYAISDGGNYLVDEQDFPSASLMSLYSSRSGCGGKTYSQLLKVAQKKRISVNYGCNTTTEYIFGNASNDNLEETLQIVNMTLREPQFEKEAWEVISEDYKRRAESFGRDKTQVFYSELNKIFYGDNVLFAPIDKKWYSMLDSEIAERVFKERFGNPADFVFIFIGDFDEKKLIDQCAYYLGTLETNDKFDEAKWLFFPFPKENKTVTVKKGNDKYGIVYLCLGCDLPEKKNNEEGFKDVTLMDQLVNYLNIRLREVIREEKSGSYDVRCSGGINGWPERSVKVQIQFNCEPERQEELRDYVIKTIEEIKAGDISDEIITKLKEGYFRSVESSLRNNNWWRSRIISEAIYQSEPIWFISDYKRIVDEWITAENLLETARRFMPTDVIVTGYLKPEK